MEHNTQALEDIERQVTADLKAGTLIGVPFADFAKEVAKRYAELQLKQLTEERFETIKMLRDICKDHGDLDWPDDLHLTDIIDKHMGKHLDSKEQTDPLVDHVSELSTEELYARWKFAVGIHNCFAIVETDYCGMDRFDAVRHQVALQTELEHRQREFMKKLFPKK